jgi:transglutaminase-like putative cysteine protease
MRDAVLSLLLFLLLLEWLRPLPALADLADSAVNPFIAALAVFIALDYLRVPAWAGWPVKLGVSLFIVGYMFSFHRVPTLQWWKDYFALFSEDLASVGSGQFAPVSAETRTVLFLIGWALLISVIHALMLQRQHILWFVAVTLAYLLSLSTFLNADTGYGVARTVCLGLALSALLQLPRLARRHSIAAARRGWPWMWVASGAMMAMLCAGIGWYGASSHTRTAPPADWSWLSERTAFFKGGRWGDDSAVAARLAGNAVSGYGRDDRRLGGPLTPDDHVVFTARTSRMTYWRGETKSYYDGKGWSDEPADASEPLALPGWLADGEGGGEDGGDDGAADETPQRVAGRSPAALPIRTPLVVQEITMTPAAPRHILFVGGAIQRLDALASESGAALPTPAVRLNPVTGGYSLQEKEGRQGQADRLSFYRVAVSAVPWGSEWNDTENIGGGPAGGRDDSQAGSRDDRRDEGSAGGRVGGEGAPSSEPLPEPLRQRYLQLPDDLPKRVAQLARTVASGAEDPLGQALLVQNYLRSNYAYSLDRPTYPKDNEDFVDHFLFKQKAGYCDHFSTAMVVMLRAIGIPARWVKGFAPGEVEADAVATFVAADGETAGLAAASSAAEGERLMRVTVRNRDAHSWVEAYLPGAGWVAFEPTPGFQAPGEDDAAELARAAAALPAAARLAPDAAKAPVSPSRLFRRAAETAAHAAALWWRPAACALLLLAPAAWAAWRWRAELAFAFAARGFARRGHHPEQAIRACDRLWRAVFRKFGGKPPQQTIREYVASLANLDAGQRAAIVAFAQLYEALRYGDRLPGRVMKRDIARLWRGMFRRDRR